MRGRGKDQMPLFDYGQTLPNGFAYYPDFITPEEESNLISIFHTLPLKNAPYKEYTAKRRILNFGYGFDEKTGKVTPGTPLPDFLRPLAVRAAARAGIPKNKVVEGLITHYAPGTGVGWHCDNEPYQLVLGISFGSWCQMDLRPLKSRGGGDTYAVSLEPRSMYVMQGESRWGYQHRIFPTKGERFSVTFRTLPVL
jgi:alkylated DNA repair dioxygenase AlkB